MINKILIVCGILILLTIGITGYFYNGINNTSKDAEYSEPIHKGPVPIGYDLEHFRKTGETINEVIE